MKNNLDSNGYAPSIVQHDYGTHTCYLTGRTGSPDSPDLGSKLDRHECFGGPLRAWSKHEGLWVYLLHNVHMKLHQHDYEAELKLKKDAQRAYERTHSREEFMQYTRKNYLGDEPEHQPKAVMEPYDISKDKLPF